MSTRKSVRRPWTENIVPQESTGLVNNPKPDPLHPLPAVTTDDDQFPHGLMKDVDGNIVEDPNTVLRVSPRK
jgi:hypothetical protein